MFTNHQIDSIFSTKFGNLEPYFAVYIKNQFEIANHLVINKDFTETELFDSIGRLVIPLSRREAMQELYVMLNDHVTKCDQTFISLFDTFFATATGD
jgi:hypothetical protein